MKASLAWGVLALTVALSLGIRTRLLDVPLERDEGEYAYVAQLVLDGVSPYTAAYSMKTPGVALVYAPFVRLLGDTPAAVRACLMLVNAATIVLVFLFACRLLGRAEGVVAAASYCVLSLGPGVHGLFANAEHFVIAFALAGLLVLLTANESRRPLAFLVGGVLLGLAILMKQHGVAFAVFGGLLLLVPREGAPRRMPAAMFALGALLPISLLVLALWWTGGLRPFLFWSIEYAWRYLSFVAPGEAVGFAVNGLVGAVASAPLVWLLALFGVCAVAWDPRARARAGFLLAFTGFSIAAVSAALRFRPHYFLFLLPALSLWAAVGTAALARLLAPRENPRWQTALQLVGVVLVLGASLAQHREMFFRLSPDEVSTRTFGWNPFPEALELARVLRDRSAPDDRIAMLASEPEIYFYAHLRAATPFLYMTELLRDHDVSRGLQREMIATIEATEPRYFVFSSRFDPFARGPRRGGRLYRWARETASREFTRIGVVEIRRDGPSQQRWGEAAALPPRTPDWLMVYERTASSQTPPKKPGGAARSSQGRSP
jgi:hypothetical protein